jgi:hypothetical protein
MTMQSWRSEFYPVPSRKMNNKEEAIFHSIKKWEGLTKENLEKHKVMKAGNLHVIHYYTTDFNIDTNSCALCALYLDELNHDNPCSNCPLYQSGKGCMDENIHSPFEEWKKTDNPEPMIRSLRALLVTEE